MNIRPMKYLKSVGLAVLSFGVCCVDARADGADDDWEWHDGSTLPQEGRGFSDTATPYVRIPDRLKAKCPPGGVWDLSRNSSGICHRFSTDSNRMRVRWKVRDPKLSTHNMTGAGRSGVDVYIQDAKTGKWKFKQGSRPMATTNELEFAWTPTRGCMIYLPLYNTVEKFEVGVRKGAYVKPLPPRKNGVTKPVVCYGTSITHGASASRPGMAWTAQAARRADVPFVDLGFAGNGKMEMSMVDVVSEIDASLYVLDCLWNMTDKMAEERFEPFVRELRKRRPDTPILCAEDCSTFKDRTNKGMFVEKTIEKLKAEDPKLWKDIYFIPNTEQMIRDGEETVDGCHPNDWGMTHMGEGFAKRYRHILGIAAGCSCVEEYAVSGEAPSLLPAGRSFRLVWNDEFNGDSLDTGKWSYRTNFWGKRAPWFATPEDGAVDVKDGKIHLKILKRHDGQYVSPQLQTGELMWDIAWDENRTGFFPLPKRQKPKFVHKYGYYECRFRLQRKPGWWSAFWMQTEQQGCSLDPAISGVEHDIMESFRPGEIIPHCFHTNGYSGDYLGFKTPRVKDAFDTNAVVQVGCDDFHTIGMLWEPDGYTVYIDGCQHGPKVGMGEGEAVSHIPEFVLLTTECHPYRQKRMTAQPDEALQKKLDEAVAAGDDFVADFVRVYDIVE